MRNTTSLLFVIVAIICGCSDSHRSQLGMVPQQESDADAGFSEGDVEILQERACVPGKTVECPCLGSDDHGVQACAEDGMSWMECQCLEEQEPTCEEEGCPADRPYCVVVPLGSQGELTCQPCIPIDQDNDSIHSGCSLEQSVCQQASDRGPNGEAVPVYRCVECSETCPENYICAKGDCVPDPKAGWVKVGVGTFYMCALHTDGHIGCWGGGVEDQNLLYRSTGTYTDVSVHNNSACGLRTDGLVDCWWSREEREGVVPRQQYEFVYAPCGLRPDGEVDCWYTSCVTGMDHEPVDPVDPPEGPFSSFAADSCRDFCGIRQDGTVQCLWGRDHAGEDEVLDPDGVFTQLSMSHDSACGLREDQSVVCWGEWSGTLQGEEPEGPFTLVSVGTWEACGLRPDGTIDCWGWMAEELSTLPEGQYQHFDEGYFNGGCGVLLDGAIDCWGWYRGFLDHYSDDMAPRPLE